MEYHVGESKYNGETIEVVNAADGFQDVTFDATRRIHVERKINYHRLWRPQTGHK